MRRAGQLRARPRLARIYFADDAQKLVERVDLRLPLASIAFREDARPVVVARGLSPAEPFDQSPERRHVSAYVRRQCRRDSGEGIARRERARHRHWLLTRWQRRPRARSRQISTPPRPSDFGQKMSLHVLAYNLKRMIAILGVQPLIQAMRAA
jgi:hypothetical protein